jgi:hypothetical protein
LANFIPVFVVTILLVSVMGNGDHSFYLWSVPPKKLIALFLFSFERARTSKNFYSL